MLLTNIATLAAQHNLPSILVDGLTHLEALIGTDEYMVACDSLTELACRLEEYDEDTDEYLTQYSESLQVILESYSIVAWED